ncbi:hypothetical protein V1478_009282 [Vespula squamosa]|uniref:Uncharacterized protein n=1 Tax=Vespula squamosa TaxID=30214 RepID=A0ABD2AP71_VESSQ
MTPWFRDEKILELTTLLRLYPFGVDIFYNSRNGIDVNGAYIQAYVDGKREAGSSSNRNSNSSNSSSDSSSSGGGDSRKYSRTINNNLQGEKGLIIPKWNCANKSRDYYSRLLIRIYDILSQCENDSVALTRFKGFAALSAVVVWGSMPQWRSIRCLEPVLLASNKWWLEGKRGKPEEITSVAVCGAKNSASAIKLITLINTGFDLLNKPIPGDTLNAVTSMDAMCMPVARENKISKRISFENLKDGKILEKERQIEQAQKEKICKADLKRDP